VILITTGVRFATLALLLPQPLPHLANMWQHFTSMNVAVIIGIGWLVLFYIQKISLLLSFLILLICGTTTEGAKKMYTHFKKGKNCIKIVIFNIYQ
jgi:hypothetical protein